jgi:alpha-L-fucosidase
VYLSPWDRHEPSYADPAAYDDFYARQLEELLTGYGPLVEVWLDRRRAGKPPGAARREAVEAGSEDRKYDWKRIIGLIKKHQPEAMIFNMGAPTIRWSGNEKGFAPDPCWNVVREEEVLLFASGKVKSDGSGSVWLPVECDVSIRDGWFWSPGSEKTLKSFEDLLLIYYRSIGRGANLLLNVPPDDRGILSWADQKRLLDFSAEVRRRFERPLGSAAGSGGELELALGEPRRIDHLVLKEDLRQGERIRLYLVEALVEGRWREACRGRAVGHARIHAIDPILTDRLRLRVLEAAAPPVVREFAAYAATGPAGDLYEAARRSAGRSGPDEGGARREAIEGVSRAILSFPAFAPFHLLRGRLEEEEGRLEESLRDFTFATELEASPASYHERANVLFRLERFREAVTDYDRAAAGGTPHGQEACWERGLAQYYLGDFAASRKQFEGYHSVDPHDIENGLWRYYSIAKGEGLEKAKATLLPYPGETRGPFAALLRLYRGEGSVAQVIEEAGTGAPAERQEASLFYAHYYLGKYFEVRGEREEALRHLKEALRHPVRHFMVHCARFDLGRLEKAGPAK